MKNFRFMHLADLHLDAEQKKKEKAESSLKQILEYCENIRVNAVIIAGDVFEKKQSFSKNSAVPIAYNFLHKLSPLVDFIFITAGNPSHDEPGSIALLHQIEHNVYSFDYPVVLGVHDLSTVVGSEVIDLLRSETVIQSIEYIVSLVPYPTKASLLIEDSIDNNNAEFIQKFEQIFEHIGDVTRSYTCPKILAFHGNVVGSRLGSGQTLVSQDIMVSPPTLELANHNYYALGHIHASQKIRENMYYSGSIFNKNWGEVEKKGFVIVEFDEEVMHITPIKLTAARGMIKVDCEFKDKEFWFDMITPDEWDNADMKSAEYRVRIKVAENERSLITDAKIEELKKQFNEDVKIEFNIIPVERESRSEKIMNCKTLLDEVKEYAFITEQPINGTIEKKVSKLQEVSS